MHIQAQYYHHFHCIVVRGQDEIVKACTHLCGLLCSEDHARFEFFTLNVSSHYALSMCGGNVSKPQCFYRICVVGSYNVSKRTNHSRIVEATIFMEVRY